MSALLSIVLLEDGAANCDVESVGFMTLGLHHRRFLEPTICNPSSKRQPPVPIYQGTPSSTRGNTISAKIHVEINSEARSRGKIHVDVMCCVDVKAHHTGTALCSWHSSQLLMPSCRQGLHHLLQRATSSPLQEGR